jgi:hypothetical protein
MFYKDTVSVPRVCMSDNGTHLKGAVMQKAKMYRQYAADCRRLAETMEKKDRPVLLNMAEAWDTRADEAERSATKNKLWKQDQPQGK